LGTLSDSAPKAVAVGFNPDAIVHCILQPLFAPEVMFRRLYAHMTQHKLDLLDLSTGNVTEPGTRRGSAMRLAVSWSKFNFARPCFRADDGAVPGLQAANPRGRKRSYWHRADQLMVVASVLSDGRVADDPGVIGKGSAVCVTHPYENPTRDHSEVRLS
jgi:hypothetical protein